MSLIIAHGLNLASAAHGLVRTGTSSVFGIQLLRNKWANWHMAKDYKRRMTVKKFAPDRLRLCTLKRNDILPIEFREVAAKELHENFPRDACMVRIRERCAITSRPRGTVWRWRVSRIIFRHLADYNKLSGVQRAMW